jgi:hypothetical protein
MDALMPGLTNLFIRNHYYNMPIFNLHAVETTSLLSLLLPQKSSPLGLVGK